uniref:Uncharacterized protein n=1 Tax=Arundo donax TaxID=35708 RepID=A0A0A9FA16_ARUDO
MLLRPPARTPHNHHPPRSRRPPAAQPASSRVLGLARWPSAAHAAGLSPPRRAWLPLLLASHSRCTLSSELADAQPPPPSRLHSGELMGAQPPRVSLGEVTRA